MHLFIFIYSYTYIYIYIYKIKYVYPHICNLPKYEYLQLKILVQSSRGSAAPPTEAGAIHAHLGPALGPGGQRPGFEHLAPPKAPPYGEDFFHGKVV